MSSSLNSLIAAGAAAWPGLIVAGTLKAGLLVGIGGLVAALLRGSSAATRHVTWTVSLIAALAVPFAAIIVPAWHQPWLPALESLSLPITSRIEPSPATNVLIQPPATAPTVKHATHAMTMPAKGFVHDEHRMNRAASHTPAPSWDAVMVSIERAVRHPSAWVITMAWLAGVLLALLRRAIASWRLARLSRRATTVADPLWLALLANCSLGLGIRRGIALRMSDAVSVPMTWGILAPVVLLPASAAEWTQARRRMVLLHELAHVRRLDTLTQSLAQMATALHWFNPLVWRAAHQLRREAEQACDDRVLGAGMRASAYAGDLLDIARTAGSDRRLASAALAMARRSQLEGRLLAILDAHRPRTGTSRTVFACAVLAATCVTAAVAAIAPDESSTRAPRATPVARVAPVTTAAPAPPKVIVDDTASPAPAARARTAGVVVEPAIAPVASAEAVAAKATRGDRSHSSMSIIDDDQGSRWKGSWTTDRGTGKIRAEGTIEFNDDATDVARISSGGSFDLEMQEGRHTRRVEIRNTRGQLDRWYWVDGHEHVWDGEARAWFADALVDLDRHTGVMVDHRFKGLMSKGGPSRVLEEIPQLSSDYVKGLYFDRLLDTSLDRPTMRRLIELAGRELESDYELGKTLAKAVDRKALDDPQAHAAFLAATDQLESDYEHGRVLMMVVSRHDISSAATAMALQSAARLSSDYERGRVLAALSEHAPFDLAGERIYLKAASELSSDYTRSQALTALLERQKLDTTSLSPLLTSIASIESDYYRSNVLVALLDHAKLGEKERELYRKAAKSIGSEYYRNRALAALAENGGD